MTTWLQGNIERSTPGLSSGMLQCYYLGVVRAWWLSKALAHNHVISHKHRPNSGAGAGMAQSLAGQKEGTLHVVHSD